MNKEVEQAFEEVKEMLPWFKAEDYKDPIELRKMANEYTREGEYFETCEPNETEAKRKYDTAGRLEILATVIEMNA
jgi:hypothetical protein